MKTCEGEGEGEGGGRKGRNGQNVDGVLDERCRLQMVVVMVQQRWGAQEILRWRRGEGWSGLKTVPNYSYSAGGEERGQPSI